MSDLDDLEDLETDFRPARAPAKTAARAKSNRKHAAFIQGRNLAARDRSRFKHKSKKPITLPKIEVSR